MVLAVINGNWLLAVCECQRIRSLLNDKFTSMSIFILNKFTIWRLTFGFIGWKEWHLLASISTDDWSINKFSICASSIQFDTWCTKLWKHQYVIFLYLLTLVKRTGADRRRETTQTTITARRQLLIVQTERERIGNTMTINLNHKKYVTYTSNNKNQRGMTCETYDSYLESTEYSLAI